MSSSLPQGSRIIGSIAATDRIILNRPSVGDAEISASEFGKSLSALRMLFDHYADGASVSVDGTEDDLYSDTIAVNRLAANGDKIAAEYQVALVAHATATRRIQGYFGGTKVIDSGVLTIAGGDTLDISLTVIRESATVVRVKAKLLYTNKVITTYTRITSLTLTGTLVLKLTGIAAGTGAAASDIVAKLGYVEFKPSTGV